nr:hypothetical protein Iba_chr03bCG3020 [Ipomoea batatas]
MTMTAVALSPDGNSPAPGALSPAADQTAVWSRHYSRRWKVTASVTTRERETRLRAVEFPLAIVARENAAITAAAATLRRIRPHVLKRRRHLKTIRRRGVGGGGIPTPEAQIERDLIIVSLVIILHTNSQRILMGKKEYI